VRLTPEEISEGLIQDITAQIAECEQEIETIDKALDIIAGDDYANVIKYKYFEGKNDEKIAEIISCDPSTVRRNKSRLVGRLAVFLYGVAAVR
jgi:RNA polymerase sigma factor (sigma-70 family)